MRPALKLVPWRGEDPFRNALQVTLPERPCCMRRARKRYWRIVRGYFGLGVALGVAVGMVLGAASKVCQ